jgi:signal transduction histidine kinase
VEISDTGAGIAKEDIGKLFTRFGKLQRTAEINSEGLGLGLTIVKQIVESA